MDLFTIFLLVVIAVLFVLPVGAYLIMKFGTAGFLRARRREKKHENLSDNDNKV